MIPECKLTNQVLVKLPGADPENQLAALMRIFRLSKKLQSKNLYELKPSWRICTGHFEQDSFFQRGLGSFWKFKDVWKLKGEDEFESDTGSGEQYWKPSNTNSSTELKIEADEDEDSAILDFDDVSQMKKSQIKSYCQFCLRRQTEGESVSIDDEIMKNFNLLTQQMVGNDFLSLLLDYLNLFLL